MDIVLPIRPAERASAQIERQLRSLIQQGKLATGQRLPSTQEMARQWKVSCSTVQQALNHLTADGLVERRPRSGTFVRAATDRVIIGILGATYVADETAYYFRSLLNAFRMAMEKQTWACRVYDGIRTSEITEYGKAQRRHLASDLQNYPFRGVIELGIQASALPEIPFPPGLAKVSLFGDRARSDVLFDEYHFGREAADYMARRNRKHILYLRTNISPESADLDGIWDAVREHKLPAPQIESLSVGRGPELEKQTFERMSRLVGQWSAKTKRAKIPDALIVADDIAMRGAALALVRHRVAVPARLLVLTHANEQVLLHYGIPVVRYEYSINELARQALDILWRRIAGEPLPHLPVSIRGRFGDSSALTQTNVDGEAP